MFNFKNNPVLLPHQVEILKLFFSYPISRQFFLTGGTALAAFYLGHRKSQDFDFFSLDEYNTEVLSDVLKEIADKTNSLVSIKVQTKTYNEVYLQEKNNRWIQRIDFVHEQPRHFGEIVTIEGVRVDSLINIASNKILAVFGRLEPKDYIDLYMIFKKTDLSFDKMFELSRQKDTGLSEFHFVNCMADTRQMNIIPELKIPLNKTDFVKFYENLSRKLLLRIKPKE